MFLLVVAIGAGLIFLWVWLSSLETKIREGQRRDARRDDRVDELLARITALEAAREPVHRFEPAPPPSAPLPSAPAPIAPPPIAQRPVAPVAQPSAQQPPIAQDARAGPPPPEEGWEVVVGTNWLNKLGVVTFVIGVAMLVAYSMTHIGAFGRVLIGYLIGGAMLTAGVVLERRALYRNYAYGLVAGGWAAIYFTAFAMHALPPARIVESDLAGAAALMAVATGMIVHSLRYRSQTVTALAYVAAFATLALTPLSEFSLVASVPLAVSLLVVAQRFGWPGVSLLGIAATYGLFVLRQTAARVEDSPGALAYATLAVYWITFEVADLLALRYLARQAGPSKRPASSLFAMNAAGIAGTALLESQISGEAIPPAWIAMAAAAYLLSAVARFHLAGEKRVETAAERNFTTMHGAVAMAALLAAWSIHRAFESSRETLALLLETEMVVAAGCSLRDRRIRSIGAALAVAVAAQAYSTFTFTATRLPLASLSSPIAMLALVAAAWYVNREAVRRMPDSNAIYDQAYTWVALLFVGIVIGQEVSPAHQGLAGLVFSAVLFEGGLRVSQEYRAQAYAAAAWSVLLALSVFVSSRVSPSPADVWISLPLCAAVSYGLAWRLSRAVSASPAAGGREAAALLGCAGTLFVAVFEWRVLPDVLIAPSWAATATGLLLAGLLPAAGAGTAGLRMLMRFQGYTWLLAAVLMAMRLFAPAVDPALTSRAVLPACVVIGFLYFGSLAGRRAHRGGLELSDLEQALRISVSLGATLSLSALLLDQVQPTALTLAWGVQGGALLAAGFPARERVLRLSGLALLLLCILKLFLHDLGQLEALPRILSFVVLGLLLLAVSWTYTRFKEQLKRFL